MFMRVIVSINDWKKLSRRDHINVNQCRTSAVLTHGYTGQLPGCPTSIRPHANLGMLRTACLINV